MPHQEALRQGYKSTSLQPSDFHLNGNNGSGQKTSPPTPIPLTPPSQEVEVDPEVEQAKQVRLRATQQGIKRLE